MPFGNYHHNPKSEIDFSKLRTVSVIANFNINGDIRPEYFRIVNPDHTEETFKVEFVKLTKIIHCPSRILFRCCYTNHNKYREIDLVYYVNECVWTIQ